MTTEEQFWRSANAIADEFIGRASTPLLNAQFKNEIAQLVLQLYQTGGCLCDARGFPIQSFDDVELIVGRSAHTISIAAVRKRTNNDREGK